jgi:hypothetical protein
MLANRSLISSSVGEQRLLQVASATARTRAAEPTCRWVSLPLQVITTTTATATRTTTATRAAAATTTELQAAWCGCSHLPLMPGECVPSDGGGAATHRVVPSVLLSPQLPFLHRPLHKRADQRENNRRHALRLAEHEKETRHTRAHGSQQEDTCGTDRRTPLPNTHTNRSSKSSRN